MKKLDKVLFELLKNNGRYIAEDGEILKNAVYEDAMKMDSALIKLLLANDICKATGFWKTSSIKHNFLLLAHEYLFVFRK